MKGKGKGKEKDNGRLQKDTHRVEVGFMRGHFLLIGGDITHGDTLCELPRVASGSKKLILSRMMFFKCLSGLNKL